MQIQSTLCCLYNFSAALLVLLCKWIVLFAESQPSGSLWENADKPDYFKPGHLSAVFQAQCVSLFCILHVVLPPHPWFGLAATKVVTLHMLSLHALSLILLIFAHLKSSVFHFPSVKPFEVIQHPEKSLFFQWSCKSAMSVLVRQLRS